MSQYERNKLLYWMDMVSSRDSRHVAVSTFGEHKQGEFDKFKSVGNQPFFT